jgi:tetratricopeptide (TPR) repeat protein
LSVRLGELPVTLKYATQLEQMGGAVHVTALAQDLAHGLRAQALQRQEQRTEALVEFEKAQMMPRGDKIVWPSFYQQSHERFLRAELLSELNRDEEALGWYGSFGWSWGYEYIYFAPSHLRRGEICERLGQRDQAIEHYTRFVELWQDCDPELRPTVEEAQIKLDHLLREKTKEPQERQKQVQTIK